MKTLHRLARAAVPVLAIALLPGAALAGTVTVVPEKFAPINVTDSAAIDPWAITSGDVSSATFTTNVRLPVGTTVKKLLYYHWGNGSATTRVQLYRTKMGQAFDPAGGDLLMQVMSAASVPINVPPQIVSTTAGATGASDLVVRPGYRYFLVASCSNSGGWINAVRVSFK